MEENTVKVNEIEEFEPVVEVEEASESSGSGAFVAGVVGGFLAYAVIGGVKKLTALVKTKMADRKRKSEVETVIDAEFTEIPDEQDEDSEEDTSEER